MSKLVNPLVSVIIPVYNSEKFIAETVKSVISQTYRPLELIVVDDGSVDKTQSVVKDFQGKARDRHLEARYIYQQNAGPSKARNTGIKAAQGEYIAFLDADDLWLPETVDKLVLFFSNNPDVALVFGDAGSFNADGVLFESLFEKNGHPDLDDCQVVKNAFEKLLEGNFILTGTVLVKRECLRRVNYFDEAIRYGEDYDLWARISLFYRIGCIGELMMFRRLHADNVSKNEHNFYDSKLFFLEKLRKNFEKEIRGLGINVDEHVMKTLRKRSYFYYLKGNYMRFLSSLLNYSLYYLKRSVFPLNTVKRG